MLRHVASAAMLLGLLVLPVNAAAGGRPPQDQYCQLSDSIYVGLTSTVDGTFVTCGTADLQSPSPFGQDDLIVAGAHSLGALSWDLEDGLFWACDRGKVVGTIAWTGTGYAF